MLIIKKSLPVLLSLFLLVCSVHVKAKSVFYEKRNVGSESLFNPASSFLNYTLDSMQVKKTFGTSNYSENLSHVTYNLRNAQGNIEDEGGYNRFINTEIFPIDSENFDDSVAILPNYGLHLFGGGLVFRKNAEWLEANDVSHPYLTAGLLAMTAEVLAEPIEKPTTFNTDEVADVFIFRPLGIWLFSSDTRAQYIKDKLDPVDWPHLMMYDVNKEELLNTGLSYVVRPRWLNHPGRRVFVYMGISNLIGVSHRLSNGDEFSWGLGVSTVTIKPDSVRESAGFFWDRRNSLLASLIVNGTEGLALRANIYPGVLFDINTPLGVFAGVSDEGDPSIGLQFGLPIGIGSTF